MSLRARSNGAGPRGPTSAELGVPVQRTPHRSAAPRGLEMLELELDQNGSPVTIEPRGWFVCIVPGLQKQWWHPFALGVARSAWTDKMLHARLRDSVASKRETDEGASARLRARMRYVSGDYQAAATYAQEQMS